MHPYSGFPNPWRRKRTLADAQRVPVSAPPIVSEPGVSSPESAGMEPTTAASKIDGAVTPEKSRAPSKRATSGKRRGCFPVLALIVFGYYFVGILLSGLTFLFGGSVLSLVVAFTFLIISNGVRLSRQRMFLNALSTVMEYEVDPIPALRAYAQDQSLVWRLAIHRFCDLLEAGDSIPGALKKSPSVLGLSLLGSPDTVLLLDVGEALGRLPSVLRRISGQSRRFHLFQQRMRARAYYLLVFFLFFSVVYTYGKAFVWPKMQEIQHDFGIDELASGAPLGTLPSASRFAESVGTHSALFRGGSSVPGSVLSAGMPDVVFGPPSFFSANMPVGVIYWVMEAGDEIVRFLSILGVGLAMGLAHFIFAATVHFAVSILRYLPIWSRFVGRLGTANLMEMLAMTVEENVPMERTLKILAERHPSFFYRRRLQRAFLQMESGKTWHEALRSAGLIRRSDAAILEAAGRSDHLEGALLMSADSMRRWFFYRADLWLQAAFVACLFFAAWLVYYFATFLVIPMNQLLLELS